MDDSLDNTLAADHAARNSRSNHIYPGSLGRGKGKAITILDKFQNEIYNIIFPGFCKITPNFY